MLQIQFDSFFILSLILNVEVLELYFIYECQVMASVRQTYYCHQLESLTELLYVFRL